MHEHYTQNSPVGDVKALKRGHTDKTLPDTPKISYSELVAVIKWLLVIFAYCWWLVIVTYFGLLADTTPTSLKILSLPIIVVSLALVRLFQMAMHRQAHGFATLFFCGLLVAGFLA